MFYIIVKQHIMDKISMIPINSKNEKKLFYFYTVFTKIRAQQILMFSLTKINPALWID